MCRKRGGQQKDAAKPKRPKRAPGDEGYDPYEFGSDEEGTQAYHVSPCQLMFVCVVPAATPDTVLPRDSEKMDSSTSQVVLSDAR